MGLLDLAKIREKLDLAEGGATKFATDVSRVLAAARDGRSIEFEESDRAVILAALEILAALLAAQPRDQQ